MTQFRTIGLLLGTGALFLSAIPCAFLGSSSLSAALKDPETEAGPIQFEEVTKSAGLLSYHNLFGSPEKRYIIESTGNGAAWFDYDNDGCIDLFVVNGSTLERRAKGEHGPGNRLYHNNCNGTFTDVTAGSGLEGGYWGSGVAAGDFDNDGFEDLYVTTVLEGNHLYHNNGNGTFTDVTAKAGVGGGLHDSASAAFFDYDRDGYLDLFVTNYVTFDREYLDRVSPYCNWKGLNVFCGPVGVAGDSNILYHNNGDGTFTDVTKAAGVQNPALKSLGVVTSDLNGDGWPDIYVASDSTIHALYRNRGDGTFEDVSLLSGAGFSQDGRAQSGMGVDAGDYDGDGRPDLFVTNFQDDYNTLYHNEGQLTFADITFLAKLGSVSTNRLSWGTGFFDLDNDGHLDLLVASGHVYPQVDSAHLPAETYAQRGLVLRNLGNGTFADVTPSAGPGMQLARTGRGAAFGDYDNDGRMDVVIVNIDSTLSLLHNISPRRGHWLTIRTIGTRSNRDGIGAQLRLTAGGRTQVHEIKTSGSFASSQDPRAHFGLGAARVVDKLEMFWPSGLRQTFANLPADHFLVLREGASPKIER